MSTSGSQFSHPLGIEADGRIALEGSLCEFYQQVMSCRSFIYTSGPQWVVILSEGEFLFPLANMATSGSQFTCPSGMGFFVYENYFE